MTSIHAANAATILSRRLLACTAIGLAFACGAANAQTAPGATPAPLQVPPVSVEGVGSPAAPPPLADGYQPLRTSNPKFTEPLRDTPQSITVIPQEVLEDRGVATLRDAIRNVPGITIGGGEG